MLELYSFSKATRFFSKTLCQPSPNVVPVIPFENGKFKPMIQKHFLQVWVLWVKPKKIMY